MANGTDDTGFTSPTTVDPGGNALAMPSPIMLASTSTSPATKSDVASSLSPLSDYSSWGNPNDSSWARDNLTTVTSPSGVKFQVNKGAAESFTGFLQELESKGYKITSGGGYNLRNITGGSTLSPHAYGLAIDINPSSNPYSRTPSGGTLTTDMPSDISSIATKYGLSWGGDWKSLKDPMHFEYTGTGPLDSTTHTVNALTKTAEVVPDKKITTDGGVSAPPVTETKNPLSINMPQTQQPMDMKQMMSMAILQSLLPKGFQFHPIDYDPFKKAFEQYQIPKRDQGPSANFQSIRIGSEPARAAYSPESFPLSPRMTAGKVRGD